MDSITESYWRRLNLHFLTSQWQCHKCGFSLGTNWAGWCPGIHEDRRVGGQVWQVGQLEDQNVNNWRRHRGLGGARGLVCRSYPNLKSFKQAWNRTTRVYADSTPPNWSCSTGKEDDPSIILKLLLPVFLSTSGEKLTTVYEIPP